MAKNKSNRKNMPGNIYGGKPQVVKSQKQPMFMRKDEAYTKNLAAIARRWPKLAEKVEACQLDNYELMPTKQGNPMNLLCKNEGFLYYGNDNDPIGDTVKQLAVLKLKNTRLAVFLGFGLGYELHVFLEEYAGVQRTNEILVIEKSVELFKQALHAADYTGAFQNEKFEFLVGVEEKDLFPAIQDYLEKKSRHVFLKAMNPVYHLSSLHLSKQYYLRTLKCLNDASKVQILNFGNDPKDSLTGVEHMLDNLGTIVRNPGINLLYGAFIDKPAIIVSAGPSLEKNKHLLKGLEDKALILCPDTSLKIMNGMGVKPHIVSSLERTDKTVPLLDCFTKEQVEDVYLAACPVIPKEAYERYPGPKVIVYRNFDHFKWLNLDKGILDIKRSSANMAFKIAEALGCNPIILIGQDLAFGEDGKIHASGTARDGNEDEIARQEKFYKGQPTKEVAGNLGGTVTTTETWYGFLKVFELDVAKYEGACINATEGGALINGTKVMPFKEAIATFIGESFDPLNTLKEKLKGFSDENAVEDAHSVLRLAEKTMREIEEIIGLCRSGIERVNTHKEKLMQWMNDYESFNTAKGAFSKIHQEIIEPKKKANELHDTFQLFLTHVFQSFHMQFEMDMVAVPERYEDFEHAKVEIALHQEEWYAVIGDISAICLNSLRNAYEQLSKEFPA